MTPFIRHIPEAAPGMARCLCVEMLHKPLISSDFRTNCEGLHSLPESTGLTLRQSPKQKKCMNTPKSETVRMKLSEIRERCRELMPEPGTEPTELKLVDSDKPDEGCDPYNRGK